MEKKFIFLKKGLMCFLLVWIISIRTVTSSCNMEIPHGEVTWWCVIDPPCPYSCHEGYKKHDEVSWLECSTSGQWVPWLSYQLYGASFSIEDLCTPKLCPTVISKGTLSEGCKAVVGSICNFSCEAVYMRNNSVSELTCHTSTEWSPDLRSLCLRPDGQQCAYDIPRGDLYLSCIREPGHTCNFTCDEGYQPSISPSTIACGSNLEWNHDRGSLCQEIICPKLIEGGYVAESCNREYKVTCSEYQCNTGYVKLARASYVTCDESGKWANPEGKSSACVKEDQLCPETFHGGYIIWHCNRIPQERCTYYCHPGYLENRSITWLTCEENRLWDVDTNSLCIESDMSTTSSSTTFRTNYPAVISPTTSLFPAILCDMQIPHGEVTWWCAVHGPPCPYSCHEGYKEHDKVSWLNCSTSGQWVPWPPYQLYGIEFSIEDLCTHMSTTSSSTTFRTNYPAVISPTTSLFPAILCDMQIPHGEVTWWCAVHGPPCPYSCHEGYKEHDKVSWLNCSTSGQWVPWPPYQLYGIEFSIEDLCTHMSTTSSSTTFRTNYPAVISPTTSLFPAILCDMQIPHGEVTWWCAVHGPPCPYSCHEGYKEHDKVSWLNCSTSGQWVPWPPYQLYGVEFSIEDLCTRESMSSFNTSRSTGEGNVGTIVGITSGLLIVMIIIVVFVVWIAKSRSSVRKSQRRVPGHASSRCLGPREYPEQHVTNIRQQPNTNGISSVSSFEPPSYNGPYVHSFVQRIPTVSSSCKYPGPPPSYSETQITPKESPPTYKEVVTDPSRFNLYI